MIIKNFFRCLLQVISRSFRDYFHFTEKFFHFALSKLCCNSLAPLFQGFNDLLMSWVCLSSSIGPDYLFVSSIDPKDLNLGSVLSSWDTFDLNSWINFNDWFFQLVSWTSVSSSSAIFDNNFAHFYVTKKIFIKKEHILFCLWKIIVSKKNCTF